MHFSDTLKVGAVTVVVKGSCKPEAAMQEIDSVWLALTELNLIVYFSF